MIRFIRKLVKLMSPKEDQLFELRSERFYLLKELHATDSPSAQQKIMKRLNVVIKKIGKLTGVKESAKWQDMGKFFDKVNRRPVA